MGRFVAFALAFAVATQAAAQATEDLAALKTSDPKRYAAEMRKRLDVRAAEVRAAPDIPQRVGARQSVVQAYVELGAFQRFRLGQPDAALASYEAARAFQDPGGASAAIETADLYRFDKRDARKAIQFYREASANLARATWQASEDGAIKGLQKWLAFEIAYLEHRRPFSGTMTKADAAGVMLWVMLSGHEPLRPVPDAQALARLPASQLQIARMMPAIFEFPPDEMLAFFAKHDPGGYVTAAAFTGMLYGQPSPFVTAAAERFFKDRGIRGPSTRPDPRYASPQTTWDAFVAAAKKGEAAAMLDCFTADMQAKLGALFNKMSPAERRAMGESFLAFSMQGADEAMIVRQVRDQRRAGFVSFANEGGSWKIGSM
ncbi:MAG TPA: hypothetical protein VIV54_02275 [Burkholderiales bacterium]